MFKRNESGEHERVKQFLFECLKRDNPIQTSKDSKQCIYTEERLEYNLPGYSDVKYVFPDVYLESNGSNFAVEYQKSIAKACTIPNKLKAYAEIGVFANYILGTEVYLPILDFKNLNIRGLSTEAEDMFNLFGEIYTASFGKGGRISILRVKIKEKGLEGFDDFIKPFEIEGKNGEIIKIQEHYQPVRIHAERLERLVLKPRTVDFNDTSTNFAAGRYLIAGF